MKKELTMRSTALHTFWLLHVFTLSTQAMVKLSMSPRIIAECGREVTLHCNISSSQDGLSIKFVEWAQESTTLCFVDSDGIVTHHGKTQSDFHCEYEKGRLSLTLHRVLPVHSQDKPYRCKQHSNQGATHGYTRVELQECSGTAEGGFINDSPSCTFRHVYPDGDVQWFQGSHNLSDGSVPQNTTKQVDAEGWLTVRSYLDRKSSHEPYNCSLKSTTSGKYISSVLVTSEAKAWGRTTVNNNGVRSQEVMTPLFILLLFAVVK